MKIEKESEIYPLVLIWLKKFLKDRNKKSEIEIYDTHSTSVAKLLMDCGLSNFFPQLNAFDIKVDITGVIKTKKKVTLAFVECKLKSITLRDVGQILGYSKVANPDYSFILSPEGVSNPLSILLQTFGRYDVLEYQSKKFIRIAEWNHQRAEIVSESILPPGGHY